MELQAKHTPIIETPPFPEADDTPDSERERFSPSPDRFLQKLEATQDPASLPSWQELLRTIVQETAADAALLFGYREEAHEWFLLASMGMPPTLEKQTPLPRGWQSLATIIAREEDHFLISKDIAEDRRFVGQIIRGTAVRTFAGTTLNGETNVFGALVIGFHTPNVMTDQGNQLFLSCARAFSSFLCARGWHNVARTLPTGNIENASPPAAAPAPSGSPAPLTPSPLARVVPNDPVPTVTPAPPSRAREERPRERDRSKSAPTGPREPAPPAAPVLKTTPRTGDEPRREEERGALLWDALLNALASVYHGKDVHKGLLRKIVLALEADMGYLFQWDQTAQRLFPVGAEGVPQEMVQRIWRSGFRPDPLWIKALEKNQSLLLPFENWNPPFKKKLCKDEIFKSQITVAIYGPDDTPWGLLSLFHRTRSFSPKELKIIEQVGERIGQTVKAVAQWNELEKKVNRAVVVQQFCDTAAYGTANLSQLLDSLKETVQASNVYFLQVDPSRNGLAGVAASTHAPKTILDVEISMDEETLAPLAVKQRQPLIAEYAPTDARVGKAWIDRFRSRSLCAIPLFARDEAIGVLLIDETAYFRRFTQDEIETLVALSHPAAAAIATAIQYQEALLHKERQAMLAETALRMHEDERHALADRVEQEVVNLLNPAQKAIQAVLNDAGGGETLQKWADNNLLLENATRSLKTILTDLRLHGLEKQGLLAAIRDYTQHFSVLTGIPVTLHLPVSMKHGSLHAEIMLYRIIQEAFCNVKKHAEAKAVILSLESKDTVWQISITDNGRGFDAKRYFSVSPAKRKGAGISGMKARADLLGGTFFIESEKEQGTRLSMKIPR